MSKAILVIDMPEKCDECPCFQIGLFNYCAVTGKRNHSETNKKPSDCPLKLIPEKYDLSDLRDDDFKCGWNACINKIISK